MPFPEPTYVRDVTLMCRDHPVATFTWDAVALRVTGRVVRHELEYAPTGCLGHSGEFNRASLGAWLRRRSVPVLRRGVRSKFESLGYRDPANVPICGYGVSLSDQYWISHDGGGDVGWSDVSPYANDFPEHLGRYLFTHNVADSLSLLNDLERDELLVGRSPEATLGGNLPKRWVVEEGERVLLKSGDMRNLDQEPYDEVTASRLCEALLGRGAHVAYGLRGDPAERLCTCRCFCSDHVEYVPAFDLLGTWRKDNAMSWHGAYVAAAANAGVDVRRRVEEMLVVDYLICNVDRHWNNFGLLRDSETREWLAPAPLFDMGNSLWHDSRAASGFAGAHMPQGRVRPFRVRLDTQLDFCQDLSWLEMDPARELPNTIREVLDGNPYMSVVVGRVEGIARAVEGRVARLEAHLRRVRGPVVAVPASVSDVTSA